MELSITPRLCSTLLKKRQERSKLSYLGAAGISRRLVIRYSSEPAPGNICLWPGANIDFSEISFTGSQSGNTDKKNAGRHIKSWQSRIDRPDQERRQ
jgi:hypothetical protein